MSCYGSRADHDDVVTTLDLAHPSGSLSLRYVEARIVDSRLEVRGVVDADTWERIQQHDIFGAASRTRSPGTLPLSGELRITLITDQSLPVEATSIPAEVFTILDAMRSVEVDELRTVGLEGHVWEGFRFSEPPVWSSAVAELEADGFEFVVGDDQSALFRQSDGLATVQFHHRSDVRLVQIVVKSPLAMGDDVPIAVYEAINGINMLVPWSTTMIDDGDVLVRETVADEVADQAALISVRVQELLGLLWVMRGPLTEVAHGDLTPQAGLNTMFTG